MEQLEEIDLKDAEVGEIVIWKTRMFGDTFAEVLGKEAVGERVEVLADNNINYYWDPTMKVFVDRS